MKVHYYPETDSLYLELRGSAASVETREVAPGVNADFDETGALIGFDIDEASAKLDVTTLETIALPLTSLKAA